MLAESDLIVETIAERSSRALTVNSRYPVLLARNLLRTLGVDAVTRRMGVTSMRMDILQQTPDRHPGLVEVEFGDEAVLDMPRDILDDVAVLVARHGWSRGNFQTIIISDVLPNKRSEYWRIISDAEKVVNVRMLTVSVLSLMIAVWRRMKGDRAFFDLFYTDEKTKSYMEDIMTRALGFHPKLTPGSSRWVEWVK